MLFLGQGGGRLAGAVRGSPPPAFDRPRTDEPHQVLAAPGMKGVGADAHLRQRAAAARARPRALLAHLDGEGLDRSKKDLERGEAAHRVRPQRDGLSEAARRTRAQGNDGVERARSEASEQLTAKFDEGRPASFRRGSQHVECAPKTKGLGD
jgi:hypothetical protein